MSYSTPVGSSFYISQTFASAKTLTIVSNANPALATSTTHGYSDDDEVVFFSGWDLANNSVFRVDQQSADTFQLTGLNSTNTNSFAAGSGIGTTQKISSWIEIPQILSLNPSGGGARYVDVRPIKSLQGLKLPDGFDAATIGFDIGFDPSLTNWDTLLDISRSGTLVAYKSVKASGAATYGYGYFSMSEAPTQAAGAADKVQATFAAQGRLISYAS